jgi:hypothetical protein
MNNDSINKPSNTTTLKWSATFKAQRGNQFYMAQRYIDSEVLRRSAKYIPFQTGALNISGTAGTVIGSGEIVYQSPYARYMYYGKVMRDQQGRAFYGSAPKHVTEEDIQYHGAPQRGKLWFERMKAAHRKAILKGAKKYF